MHDGCWPERMKMSGAVIAGDDEDARRLLVGDDEDAGAVIAGDDEDAWL